MGKVELNKENKRSSLLSHAYELFLNKGFNDTTISDIAKKSNVAKGTFYLYFKDKYDLRDQLVARQSAQIFLDAAKSIEMMPTEKQPKNVSEYVDALINYILDFFQKKQLIATVYDPLTNLWTRQRFEVEANKMVRNPRAKFMLIEQPINHHGSLVIYLITYP